MHIEYHKKCMSFLSQSRSGSPMKLLVPLILHAGNVRSIGHCRFSLVLQIGRHKEPAKFPDVPLKTELQIKTAEDNSRIQICEIDNMLCSGRATSRFLWSRIVRLQAKSQCDAWDHHWGSVGFCWILHDLVMFQYVSTGGSSLNWGMRQECLLYPSLPLSFLATFKHDAFGASGPPMDHADQSGRGEWHSGSSMLFLRNSLRGVVQSSEGAELWQFVVHKHNTQIHSYISHNIRVDWLDW